MLAWRWSCAGLALDWLLVGTGLALGWHSAGGCFRSLYYALEHSNLQVDGMDGLDGWMGCMVGVGYPWVGCAIEEKSTFDANNLELWKKKFTLAFGHDRHDPTLS